MPVKTDTFLGANTPIGFVSLFDELYDPYQEQHLYIIKGGPGCGKSTFLKRVAEKAIARGLSAELVHCGSDPDSLDGVILPDCGIALCDGTAPHVMEPKFPGVSETILNFGRFWDSTKLQPHAADIRRLTLECAIFHRRSTRFLQAAGTLSDDMIRVAAPAIDEEKLAGYALRFCNRELQQKKPAAPGRRLHRYLSGITPRGNLAFVDTVAALAARVIAVADETGAVAGKLVEQIGERAIAAGYDAVFCRNPLQPNGDSEHLILPQASLAIVTQKRLHAYHFAVSRTLHAQRFLRDDLLSKKRARLNFDRQLIRSLLDESIAQQQLAKQTHDQLETFYAAAMDFDALQAYTESFANSLFATALKRGAKRANA